jgi:2-amino-4-hydroxy-6-hydroxymethyldihydropteridine diphosphokinase
MPIIAYIGLGSNMGDKLAACRRALELLSRAGRVTRVSPFYCTEPVGYPDQETFLNAVAELETELSPLALLAACHVIEEELGRDRMFRWGPRTIDLDILLYGDQVVNTGELTIPHALMSARRFVLTPLNELAPLAVHPVSKKTVSRLLEELDDPHRVVRCES